MTSKPGIVLLLAWREGLHEDEDVSIGQGSPCMCVGCVCVREGERERERETGRETVYSRNWLM